MDRGPIQRPKSERLHLETKKKNPENTHTPKPLHHESGRRPILWPATLDPGKYQQKESMDAQDSRGSEDPEKPEDTCQYRRTRMDL